MLKLAKNEIKCAEEYKKISNEVKDSSTIIVTESLRLIGRMAFDVANEIENCTENFGE